ncbi:MAG: ChbG/HpnK family deacetylase [Alphaproteobacteria bacterium]
MTAIPIVLCADDYGLSPAVDGGIATLAQCGRLTAVSCLAVLPRWPHAALQLAGLSGRIDIGLHFALTEFAPLGPMPRLAPHGTFPALSGFGQAAATRRLDHAEIATEFSRQFDAFVAATGRTPDFVDGHHHVHQFPVVRDVVAEHLRALDPPVWVRNTATTPWRLAKRRVALPRATFLAALGVAGRRAWRRAGLPTNADFAGVRDFDERAPYETLFRRFLVDARPGLLVMCHPGGAEAGSDDGQSRAGELHYLRGARFMDDLAAAGCRLARFTDAARR